MELTLIPFEQRLDNSQPNLRSFLKNNYYEILIYFLMRRGNNILNKDKYLQNPNAIYSKLHDYCSVDTCIVIRDIVVTTTVPFCIRCQTQQV